MVQRHKRLHRISVYKPGEQVLVRYKPQKGSVPKKQICCQRNCHREKRQSRYVWSQICTSKPISKTVNYIHANIWRACIAQQSKIWSDEKGSKNSRTVFSNTPPWAFSWHIFWHGVFRTLTHKEMGTVSSRLYFSQWTGLVLTGQLKQAERNQWGFWWGTQTTVKVYHWRIVPPCPDFLEATDGSYGDHITLQASADSFNSEIVLVPLVLSPQQRYLLRQGFQ